MEEDRWGRWFCRGLMLALVLLVTVQGVMTREPWRFYLSWAERLSAEREIAEKYSSALVPLSLSPQQTEEELKEAAEAVLTLEVVNFSSLGRAVVRVNGKDAGNFRDKSLPVRVRDGDFVEIDTAFYPQPVKIRISHTSSNLRYPRKDEVLELRQEVINLGPIKIKG